MLKFKMLILFSPTVKVIGVLSPLIKCILNNNKSFSEAVLNENQK